MTLKPYQIRVHHMPEPPSVEVAPVETVKAHGPEPSAYPKGATVHLFPDGFVHAYTCGVSIYGQLGSFVEGEVTCLSCKNRATITKVLDTTKEKPDNRTHGYLNNTYAKGLFACGVRNSSGKISALASNVVNCNDCLTAMKNTMVVTHAIPSRWNTSDLRWVCGEATPDNNASIRTNGTASINKVTCEKCVSKLHEKDDLIHGNSSPYSARQYACGKARGCGVGDTWDLSRITCKACLSR